jgi:tRNA uridine 5-carboxymethylaminomethyl modification enzyme
MLPIYDVIVVGGGHAGCEAAVAAANLGSKTLLITMDMTKYAQMSCNPAMGGIAKGQIIREIDALGGFSGIVTDQSSIQFRMLNQSKGPAMWSPRAQCDRVRFTELWRHVLEKTDNLDLWQDAVVGLHINDKIVTGVKTKIGVDFYCKSVVLTNGTFLNGLMHIGRSQMEGGRIGESASYHISEQLFDAGFRTGRLKTGTPVRIDGRSINFSKLLEQQGDEVTHKFSYLPEIATSLKQKSCWITYTNEEVHKILEEGFADSPMYNGTIVGAGPRYCPSIESKIVTFAERTSHQLFLEPEGEDTIEYYLNGFSSSLPWDVQLRALKLVPGLEDVRIFRPGYAIEYDYFDPTQLSHSLRQS